MSRNLIKALLPAVFLLISGLVPGASPVLAYSPKNLPNPKNAVADNFVSNPDGLLSPACVNSLEGRCRYLRDSLNVEVAVVAVKSIDGYEAADFAQELFMHWGIGGKDKNQGLLVLLATGPRDLRIQTGGGLEGLLPDAVCTRIFRQVMRPHLAEGRWEEGLTQGLQAIQAYLTDPEAVAELLEPGQSGKDDIHPINLLYFYLIVAGLLALYFLWRINRYAKWNPSADNSQRYAKGHGLHYGLLCCCFLAPVPLIFLLLYLNRVRRAMRRLPLTCPQCGQAMNRLSEDQEDAYLCLSRQVEENLDSVDYDVWLCPQCGRHEILQYKNHYNRKYTTCPQCGARTLVKTGDRVVQQPSSRHTGTGEKTYTCRYCQYKRVQRYTIPKVNYWSSGSGHGPSGGSWGGGVSFGGGGGGHF